MVQQLGNIGAMKEWGEVRQARGTCKALKGDGSADFVAGVAEIDLDCDNSGSGVWLVLKE